jgi:hypothetical protein
MESKYFGLIEVVVTAVIFGAWWLWDRRNLRHDIKAREERERTAAGGVKQHATSEDS